MYLAWSNKQQWKKKKWRFGATAGRGFGEWDWDRDTYIIRDDNRI